MRIESNIGTTLLSIKNSLVNDLPIATEKALRLACLDAGVIVQDRVQRFGDGTKKHLQTRSIRSFGVYSLGHQKSRDKKGLQTGIVDLTFNGDLWRAWQLLKSDTNSAEFGFLDDSQADKASYHEDYYGDVIYALREGDEEEQVLKTFNSEFETAFLPKIS